MPSNTSPEACASRCRTVEPGGPAGSSSVSRPRSVATSTVSAVTILVTDAHRKTAAASPAARQHAGRSDDRDGRVLRAPRVDRREDGLEIGHGRKRTGTSVVARLVRPVGDGWPSRRHPMRMPRLPIARPRSVALLLAGLLTVGTASVAGATEFPAGRTGLPQLHGDGRRGRRGRGRPPVHRVALLDRQELPGPPALGGQDLGQRRGRRSRARGHVRRHPPRRRAHGHRDDPAHPPLAGRRLRRRPADHLDRQHARDLDRVHGQPGRRRVRHLRRHVPPLAQEPPADAGHDLDRDGPQPELRLPLGRRRPDQLEPAGDHLPRDEGLLDARGARDARLPGQPRRQRPPADPGRDHASTRTAGWSCGRTATRSPTCPPT